MANPTPEEIAAAQQQEADKQQQIPPQAPQGETPEELKERLAKTEKNYEELRAAFNRRDAEIAELRKNSTSSTDTDKAKIEDDRKYLNSLGYLTKDQVEEELNKREAEREEKRKKENQEASIKERAIKIAADMKEATAKFQFINEAELLEFMRTRNISVMEAAKLKYETEFEKLKTSPDAPVITDATGKGGMEPQEPLRNLRFKDRVGMAKAITETVKNAAAIK